MKKCPLAHFGSIWAHLGPSLPPPPPRGGLGCGRLAGGGWGGGGARVGWAASGARSGERRPPLSGSGASAPEVVPLHSYPRRGLIGTVSGSLLGPVPAAAPVPGSPPSRLGVVWESSGSRLGAVWESPGSRLGVVWGTSGRRRETS